VIPNRYCGSGSWISDGQTTNPSLIAKNPDVKKRVASGHALSEEEGGAEYRRIVQAISPLAGSAGVSIEVFADLGTAPIKR
jgi:transaldolase